MILIPSCVVESLYHINFKAGKMLALCLLVTMMLKPTLTSGYNTLKEKYYTKTYEANGPLQTADVISCFQVFAAIDCSFHCGNEEKCTGFNHREKTDDNYAINCQLSKGKLKRINEKSSGEWTYYESINKIKYLQANDSAAENPQNVTCSSLRKKYPNLPNGTYYINPQNLSSPPFPIYCDMTSKNGVGVTVISHDSEARTYVSGFEDHGKYVKKVGYEMPLEQVVAIINQSKNCEQFIKYECHRAFLLFKSHSWWVSRQGEKMNYWGGAAVDSGKCACGMNNSCVGGGICNCATGDNILREDSGFLSDRNTLPVSQLRFGDTGSSQEYGFHTLGKLLCWGHDGN